MRLYFDVETRSPTNIKVHGAMRHLADPEAGINCIGWAVDNNPIMVTKYHDCHRGSELGGFRYALSQADVIVAHKAQFDVTAMELILDVQIPVERVVDSMAKCAHFGYPRNLDDAAQAIGCTVLKDVAGKNVMERLATGKWTPETAPDDFNRLYHYNVQDIEPMRQIDQLLPDLPPELQAAWLLDYQVNRQGVPIDVRAVHNALQLIAILEIENDARIQQLTAGYVQTTDQTAKIQEFIKLTYGIEMPDCTADTVDKLLFGSLPDGARKVLQLRQDAGLASLKKYQKMKDYLVGDRLYFCFDFFGTHTLRSTSTGVQVQNFARPDHPPYWEKLHGKDGPIPTEYWAELLSKAPVLLSHFDAPGDKLKDGLRGVICAPDGYEFVGMDLSQIEARATGWVAGEESFLDLFRSSDPYCTYGKFLFGRTITKKDDPHERTAAKATVLAYGFAGGIGAGQRAASNYKIDFEMLAAVVLPSATPSELAEGHRNYEYYLGKHPAKPLSERHGIAVDITKQRYRRDFPKIKQYWVDLEDAFLYGGVAGPVSVEAKASGLRIVTLPSGRQAFYHGVKQHFNRVVQEDGSEKTDKGYSYNARRGRKFIWKGVLIENVAQCTNADISEWYKIRANKIAPVAHHCHDEFTLLARKADVPDVLARLKELTQTQRPPWCEGLPLGFDYWTGRRYGK